MTANYSRPDSPLQRHGLFGSDLGSSAAVLGRGQHQHILNRASACKETETSSDFTWSVSHEDIITCV